MLFRIVMCAVLLLLLGNHSASKNNRLDAIFEPEPGVLVPFRSRQDRTPARIRSVLRRRQAAQVHPGQVDLPQARLAFASARRAEKLDDAAVRDRKSTRLNSSH